MVIGYLQIDADEIPNEYLIEALPFILEANADTEALLGSKSKYSSRHYR